MSEHYVCLMCGAKDYEKENHDESPRHQRASANFALRIAQQFGNCPWCEPKGKKKNIPVKWPCADEGHKKLLAECKKLAGPLDQVPTANKNKAAEVRR